MREIFTHQEMLSVTRLSAAQASTLIRSGDLRPVSVGTGGKLPGGKTNPARWTASQVLGISVANVLRLLSVPTKVSWEIARLIGATSRERLEALFREGRTHLGVIVACGYVYPSLIRPQEVLADDALAKTAVERTGIPPVAIDVQRLWQNLQRVSFANDDSRKPVPQHDNQQAAGIVPRAERFGVPA